MVATGAIRRPPTRHSQHVHLVVFRCHVQVNENLDAFLLTGTGKESLLVDVLKPEGNGRVVEQREVRLHDVRRVVLKDAVGMLVDGTESVVVRVEMERPRALHVVCPSLFTEAHERNLHRLGLHVLA